MRLSTYSVANFLRGPFAARAQLQAPAPRVPLWEFSREPMGSSRPLAGREIRFARNGRSNCAALLLHASMYVGLRAVASLNTLLPGTIFSPGVRPRERDVHGMVRVK